IVMVSAYGWAFTNPVRRMRYNLTVTSISVATALLIGGIELLGLIGDELGGGGAVWGIISELNGSVGGVCRAIVTPLAACWLISALIDRRRDIDAPTAEG